MLEIRNLEKQVGTRSNRNRKKPFKAKINI